MGILSWLGIGKTKSFENIPPHKRPEVYLRKLPKGKEYDNRRQALLFVKDLLDRRGTDSPASLLMEAKVAGVLKADPLTWVNLVLVLSLNHDIFLFQDLRQTIIQALADGKKILKSDDTMASAYAMTIEKEANAFLDKYAKTSGAPTHSVPMPHAMTMPVSPKKSDAA